MSDHDAQHYDNIGKAKVDAILQALIDHGSAITGTNPWDVDTRKHGVILKGEWNEAAQVLTITVTKADWYVPRKAVWENIDSLMQQVQNAG